MTEETASESTKSGEEIQAERYSIVQKVMAKETFIDPLDADLVTRAYSMFEKNPQKIVEEVTEKFKFYCRKCIKEIALIDHKNEISNASTSEAEKLKSSVVNEIYGKVKADPVLEQLLIMLIFKNKFWEWIRYGLKEVLNEQRMQPGHEINTVLNTRFHILKKTKNIKMVGDLIVSDVTEIVNSFKNEVMKKNVKLF
ncbi:hypothetical protein KKA14_22345 [bacterium]|nr:hypothetical protein [bacterium]